jgi:hypothetical protein
MNNTIQSRACFLEGIQFKSLVALSPTRTSKFSIAYTKARNLLFWDSLIHNVRIYSYNIHLKLSSSQPYKLLPKKGVSTQILYVSLTLPILSRLPNDIKWPVTRIHCRSSSWCDVTNYWLQPFSVQIFFRHLPFILFIHLRISVGIVTGYGLDGRWIGVRFLVGPEDFSPHCRDRLWIALSLLSIECWELFPRG